MSLEDLGIILLVIVALLIPLQDCGAIAAARRWINDRAGWAGKPISYHVTQRRMRRIARIDYNAKPSPLARREPDLKAWQPGGRGYVP